MAFNGKYRRGYMRTLREQKREEAEARNKAYQASKAARQPQSPVARMTVVRSVQEQEVSGIVACSSIGRVSDC